MTVIVTDRGFADDDWVEGAALDLPTSTDPETLRGQLAGVTMVRVQFPSFADGRGFTLARQIRRMGYVGRLRATGPLIADQYAMARRAGFDEVEIPPDLAVRQPEPQWLARANWQAHDYQSRLRA